MKTLNIDNVEKGMDIGESIFDDKGKLLIKSGTTLTDRIIKKLKLENKKTIKILEEGEKGAEETDSVGMSFLNGLKNRYGSIKNIKDNKNSSKEKKNSLKNKTSLVSNKRGSTDKNKKAPIVSIIRKDTKVSEDEVKILNEFLKELKKDLKKIVLEIKEEGTIIKFNLNEKILKIFNNIITKKTVLKALKNLKKYDEYLYLHAIYVSLVSMVTGEKLGYDIRILQSIGIAGLFLDTGMSSVPKEIINKKALLKPEEREIVNKHPAKSYAILSKVSIATEIAKEIVLNHHERVDGTGYPKKKNKEKLSEYVKLVTIIDVYHALRSDRPYHKAKNSKEAFFTIFMYKGKQFDADILAELVKLQGGN
ncbi:HD-GYP domain-containing protein [Haliovirga abyssi]|uniref:HD-GYP domain-containing protein n=1 Tax=Haliovirga abyssi TaxID=2996794 RepID=A0AAU9DBM2_9FUSO|nr:HD domain-containing phosphohydrolase [Haliovirga abyssi]BDU49508.1 hypothetical protein HLVA_00770 [Haliovirga abyssi]